MDVAASQHLSSTCDWTFTVAERAVKLFETVKLARVCGLPAGWNWSSASVCAILAVRRSGSDFLVTTGFWSVDQPALAERGTVVAIHGLSSGWGVGWRRALCESGCCIDCCSGRRLIENHFCGMRAALGAVMIAVSEINTFEELANLRVTWRELWEKTPNASFVQSWDWLRSYWRTYGDKQELRILLVTLRTKPIGIVPLVTRHVETALGATPVLSWPKNTFVPFYGAIGPNPAATLSTAFSHVRRTQRNWKSLELPQIDEFGHDNLRTNNALRIARLKACRNGAVAHPVVDMSDRWDDYMGSRDVSARMEYLQSEKIIAHCGPISFHRWRPEGGKVGATDRRWDLFRVFEEIRRVEIGVQNGPTSGSWSALKMDPP
jgi:hypothetical protein